MRCDHSATATLPDGRVFCFGCSDLDSVGASCPSCGVLCGSLPSLTAHAASHLDVSAMVRQGEVQRV